MRQVYNSEYCISKEGAVIGLKGKPLTAHKTKKGYYQIVLRKLGKCFYIHRLVAEHYLPNPNGLEEVNHKNLDKSDNRVENLEWVTHEDNMKHAARLNAMDYNKIRGENNKVAKMTDKQAHEVCQLLLKHNKRGYKNIAAEVGCSVSTVQNIASKKAWKNISANYNI